MTGNQTPARRRVLRLAPFVAALAAGIVATGVAAPAPSGGPAAARRDVAALLTRLDLPPGAAASAGAPAGAGAALVPPPIVPATPNAVTSRAYWTVPGTPGDVIAYVAAHPPAGGRPSLSGGATDHGTPTASFLGFGFPPTSLLGSRTLAITAVADGPATTAVLAAAADVWLTARPASERVPGRGVLAVIVRTYPRLGVRAPARSARVVARAEVDRLIAAVNRLPADQPGVRACPADNGSHVDLDFRGGGSGGGLELARVQAQSSGCGGVRLVLRGRVQPELAGGPDLTAAVRRIVGF